MGNVNELNHMANNDTQIQQHLEPLFDAARILMSLLRHEVIHSNQTKSPDRENMLLLHGCLPNSDFIGLCLVLCVGTKRHH